MGEAHGDEEVVQMGLIGMEGGGTTQDAHAHDTYGVEHGDGQHGQREGYKTYAPTFVVYTAGLGLKDIENKDAHNDTHNKGTSITNKHLTGATKHIVEEEGYQ